MLVSILKSYAAVSGFATAAYLAWGWARAQAERPRRRNLVGGWGHARGNAK
jgi:hypothetical protein